MSKNQVANVTTYIDFPNGQILVLPVGYEVFQVSTEDIDAKPGDALSNAITAMNRTDERTLRTGRILPEG